MCIHICTYMGTYEWLRMYLLKRVIMYIVFLSCDSICMHMLKHPWDYGSINIRYKPGEYQILSEIYPWRRDLYRSLNINVISPQRHVKRHVDVCEYCNGVYMRFFFLNYYVLHFINLKETGEKCRLFLFYDNAQEKHFLSVLWKEIRTKVSYS